MGDMQEEKISRATGSQCRGCPSGCRAHGGDCASGGTNPGSQAYVAFGACIAPSQALLGTVDGAALKGLRWGRSARFYEE